MNATVRKMVPITDEADIVGTSRSLKAMAHPVRLEILCLLGAGAEVNVQDIVERVGISQSNVSQHLSILRDRDILASRKDANKVYYRIANPRIRQLIGSLHGWLCAKSKA
jgi:ArsR family transcriptional regulator